MQNNVHNTSNDSNDSTGRLPGNQYAKNDTTLLVTSSVFHKFSDSVNKDLFSLKLKGDRIINGTIVFEIVDSKKKIIHSESFPASGWVELYDYLSTREKEDTIRARMKSFFKESQFIVPAISIAPIFDDDNSEKAIWEEVNSDKAAIGFVYSYGYEGTYAITFSKKTVLYFYSD